MIKKVFSASIVGLDAAQIQVEADVSNGLPKTVIVGLPDTAVQESRQRVKAAVKNSGCAYPQTRVTVNLAPADLSKAGSHFDLPIALAILLASGQIGFDPRSKIFVGELSLDGTIRSVAGVLAIALMSGQAGIKEIFVPRANAKEAALVTSLNVIPVLSLQEIILHLSGQKLIPRQEPVRTGERVKQMPFLDFAEIAGQALAKRALEIASAGMHNLIIQGPPGAGKTMLARAIPGILPPLSPAESLELTKIYSIAGKLNGGVVLERPFRQPHNSSSYPAMVGGGAGPRPGEITLAHRGILFLDEFPQFSRPVLESLRQPLEEGIINVSRAKNTLVFPARFMLVAALNPCPCGYLGDQDQTCSCHPYQIKAYRKKLSGPLLDRIDLHLTVQKVPYKEIINFIHAESSEKILERVVAARAVQARRFSSGIFNSEMTSRQVREFCRIDAEGERLLEAAAARFNFSGRSIHRLLRLSRTIADLAGAEKILPPHLAEAIQYRIAQD